MVTQPRPLTSEIVRSWALEPSVQRAVRPLGMTEDQAVEDFRRKHDVCLSCGAQFVPCPDCPLVYLTEGVG
jgi:hypothetical protein